MNKYKVIILSLLISFMGASCEDWLYDNVNEDAAHEVLPHQVLPVVLFYSAQLQFDHAEYGAYLTQTLTTGGRNQTSSFAYKSGWGDFLTMNRHPQWRRHFYDIGANAKEIIDEAHEAQAWNLELISRTLRLMSTQMTTDLFGDMPRSEAYESNSPHYDTQESIYEWMNQEIEELIGMYEDPTYTEAATNIPIDQSIDRVFAGDLNKWKHYTYALKARLLLRKLPNWENNAATCQAMITAVNRALEGWEDVLYRFDGGNGAQNSPWGEAFGSTEQGGLGWEGRGNMLNSAVPTKYFMENILGVFESHNNLKGWAEDPRILAFMSARPVSCPECEEVVTNVVNNYVDNVVYFRINSAKIDKNQQVSIFNTAQFMKENNVPIKVIGYADKKTGTGSYNMQLSEKRARAVAKELIDKYGISSSQITIEWKGSDVQPYNENNWNRVVIMSANN